MPLVNVSEGEASLVVNVISWGLPSF